MRFATLSNFLNGTSLSTPEDAPEGEQEELETEAAPEGEEEEQEEEAEEEEEAEPTASTTAATSASTVAEAAQTATANEARRWATVLSSDEADGRLELAVASLVEGVDEGKQMSADSIIRLLGVSGKSNSAASRLSTTPKRNLGGNAPSGESNGQESRDAAAASRKRALATVNARHGKGQVTTSAAARAGTTK